MSTVMDQIVARQNQLLELAEAWQKPVLDAVNRAAAFAEGRAAKLPKLPSLPFVDELPKPSEFLAAQFDFAAKLVETNKRFAIDLADAVQHVASAAEEHGQEASAN